MEKSAQGRQHEGMSTALIVGLLIAGLVALAVALILVFS